MGLAVVLCALAGIAVTALPFKLERCPDFFEQDAATRGLIFSTMTNIGTALLLAAVLLFVERGFIKKVSRITMVAATQAATDATATIRQETRDLSARLDEVQRQVQERVTAVHDAEDAAVAQMTEDASFESVSQAIEVANSLAALGHGNLIVPASSEAAGPRLIFDWYHDSRDTFSREPGDYFDISYVVERNTDPTSPYRPSIVVTWAPEQSVADMGASLIQLMRREGFATEASKIDLGIALGRLQQGLADAIASKRGDDTAWFDAPLFEVITPDLVVSAAGVEHREQGVVIPADDFPEAPPEVGPASKRFQREPFAPPKPDWCDVVTWRVAIERGLRIHPRQQVPAAFSAVMTRIPKGSGPS